MPHAPTLNELRASLDAYLEGASGVRFDLLACFAEPLFELYQVDLRSTLSRNRDQRDAEELAALLAVLETARLFWAFFLLPREERSTQLPRLQKHLLGPRVDAEERRSFLELLTLLQSSWDEVADQNERSTEAPGYRLPSFDMLLESYQTPGVARPAGYGTDNLEPAEALALFAQPLLEETDVQQDPDRLDEAMQRASAYWDLAQKNGGDYEEELASLKKRFGTTPEERERVEEEALAMAARFEQLFPNYT